MPAVALPSTPPVLLHVTHQAAERILDRLAARGRIVAFSKPHVTLADLIAAAAHKIGPARLTVCVWEVGQHDVEKLVELHAAGAFLSARFIVPPAANGADEAHYSRFREIFGPDAIVEAACHAKVACLENERWSVAIRGSMNMYSCGDLESFDIDDSPEICALVHEYAEDPETEARYPKPKEAAERCDRLVAAHLRARCRFFGLAAGYDLPAIVRALLRVTGPATVNVLTAYIGTANSQEIAALPGSRLVFARSSTTLDHGGTSAKAALEHFGAERVRLAMNHGKAITIRNAAWNLTIRGSANMSRNLRVEQFDITDDAAIADQADAVIDHFFRETPPGIRVPQTKISNALRRALNDTAADPSDAARGPIRLRSKRNVVVLPRLLGSLPAGLLRGPVPLRAPSGLVVLPSRASTATASAAVETPRHVVTSSPEATTERGPITLPRARGAALQLPLLPPEAPTRPGAAGSSPPRA